MRSTTLLITAAILTVTACGANEADEPPPSSNDPTGDVSGETVAARLILLADSATAAVAPPTVLAGPTSVDAYPGWFSGEPGLYNEVRKAFAAQPDYPHASQPLIAFTNAPSCASIEQAELMIDGTQVYAAFQGQDREECLTPHTQVAIFQVDRAELPKDFTLVGTDTSGAEPTSGPGELLAFEELRSTPGYQPPPAREVTEASALDDFAAALPSHQAELGEATEGLGDGQRAFGFVLTGCAATTAELIVTPSRLTAATVGGEAVRCIAPVHHAAVFAVDADNLPARFAIR